MACAGLPLYVTNSVSVFPPESVTAYLNWQSHGVEVNESSREALDFLDLAENRRALLDIGAQTGFISAMFARSRRHPARILSVEPDPQCLPLLRRAIDLNGHGDIDWQIAAVAVSDSSGPISMPLSNQFYESAPMERDGPGEIEVEATTLVDLVGRPLLAARHHQDRHRILRVRDHLSGAQPVRAPQARPPARSALGDAGGPGPRGRGLPRSPRRHGLPRHPAALSHLRRLATCRQIGGGLPHGPRAVMSADGRRVLVVLSSLAAEGTPRLVLELCRIWQRDGIRPVVALLRPRPDDLAPEFDALGIERVCLDVGDRGYLRYARLMIEHPSGWRAATARTPCSSMPLGWHAFMAYGARLGGCPPRRRACRQLSDHERRRLSQVPRPGPARPARDHDARLLQPLRPGRRDRALRRRSRPRPPWSTMACRSPPSPDARARRAGSAGLPPAFASAWSRASRRTRTSRR